jgi:hypothetical protein
MIILNFFLRPSRLIFNVLTLPLVALSQALIIFGLVGPALKLPINWVRGSNEVSLFIWITLAVALILVLFSTYGRAKRAGWNAPWLFAVLSALPFIGIGSSLWLGMSNDREKTQTPINVLSVAEKLITPILGCWLVLIILSVVLDKIFHQNGFLSLTLFVLLPFVTAGIAAHIAAEAGLGYVDAIGAAITSLSAVLFILGFALMEGVICMIMAMPIGLTIGFLGASFGYWIAKKFRTSNRQVQAVGWLCVALCIATEEFTPLDPRMGLVSTSILIHAPAEKVWAELHNIHDLPPPTTLLFQFGVAHPIATITEKSGGIGAQRLCRLSTGDMPEIINVWRPNEELRFDVLETPATMKEAAFFGQTIDTAHLHNTYQGLEGGFRLVRQPNGDTLLIGESRYLLSIAPNFYWNLWTEYIVHQVHQRILEHIKVQAEKASSAAR